jgi:hypothetical protein
MQASRRGLEKPSLLGGVAAVISTIRTNLLHHAGIWHDAWLTSSRLGKSVRPGLSRNVLRVAQVAITSKHRRSTAAGLNCWDATISQACSRVLLQSSARDKATVSLGHSQAAMSNSEFTKAAWATMSFPPIPLTCPFLIIARVSYPTRVRHAVRNLLKLRTGWTSRFIRL